MAFPGLLSRLDALTFRLTIWAVGFVPAVLAATLGSRRWAFAALPPAITFFGAVAIVEYPTRPVAPFFCGARNACPEQVPTCNTASRTDPKNFFQQNSKSNHIPPAAILRISTHISPIISKSILRAAAGSLA
jgi:hypothetical protein